MAVDADSWVGQGNPTANRSGTSAGDLFEQHSKMVLGVCRALLVDPVEAEDAMQQTFLHAHRSIRSGSEPLRPGAWLATIARNECLNRIRARTRRQLAEPVPRETRGAPDALNAAIAREDLHTLGRTIRELPAQQREALLLHELHGLPYRDVAAAIGVSESAIASLLFRARTRLRAVLHRAYASLPVPALWNAADHLFTRAPATSTAVPVVAKLGTAAVAVGLTAGAAVVVDHGVQAHHRPPPLPPAHHRAASPAPAPAPQARVARATTATYAPRAVRPAAVRPTGRTHSHTASRGKASAPQAKHAAQAPVSLPHPRGSDTTTPAHGGWRAAADARESTNTKAGVQQRHGRALGRSRPPKEDTGHAAASKPEPSKASAVSSSASHGRRRTERHRNATPGHGSPGRSTAAAPEQHGNDTQDNAGADHGNGHAHQGH